MDRPSFLILNENQSVCENLLKFLPQLGCDFQLVSSLQELIELLQDKRFDIFFLLSDKKAELQPSIKKLLEKDGFLFWVFLGPEETSAEDFDLVWPLELCSQGKNLEFMLKNIYQLARRMKKQKEMASLVLHDLRTPLQNLNSYVELLNQDVFGELNPGQKKIISNILLQSDLAIELLQEISDILRFKRRFTLLPKSKIQFSYLLNEVIRSLWVMADRKNIKIQSICPKDLPEIQANAVAIKRVLFNLILNAIKFSAENGLIRINVKVNAKKKRHLLVQISDSGPGIPVDHLVRIFEMYYRLEQPQSIMRGSGLGLFIAKTLVEEHGGTIAAYNNREGGSTFYFTLPID
ncbi:MAG: HAMP domain-containing histidine kinase [Caldisericaceae bacterium]|nr:HAMP domain-containing histidine kinase [Caldisericaceae bacterium]